MSRKGKEIELEIIDKIRIGTGVEATPVGLRVCLTQLALEAEQAGFTYLAGKIRESAQCASDIEVAHKASVTAASRELRKPQVYGRIVVPRKRSFRQH